MNINNNELEDYNTLVKKQNKEAKYTKRDISNNHCTIQGWMIQKLDLKGNELIVYAVIYGITQDGKTWYDGGLEYLSCWSNTGSEAVRKILKNLVDKNLILKEDIEINNIKFCKYKINLGEATFFGEDQKISTNNVVYDNNSLEDNNTNTINSNTTYSISPKNLGGQKTGLNLGIQVQKNTRTKTQKFIDAIVDKFQNEIIRDNLVKYYKWLNTTEPGGISLVSWENNLNGLLESKSNFRDPNHMAEYIDWCIGRKRMLRKKSPAGQEFNNQPQQPVQQPKQASSNKLVYVLTTENMLYQEFYLDLPHKPTQIDPNYLPPLYVYEDGTVLPHERTD